MSATRILIVDDDPALLEALSETLRLRLEKVQVETANSGPAALERIAQQDYEVIISDIKMPGIDGLALLASIREKRPSTPTLLITGHGQHNLAVQALRGGAYDFIQKPIDREYFVASLNRALRMRQLSRKVEEQQRTLEQHASELEKTVDEATRELREANQAKDEFLALLAHELRNPLAPLKNAVELIGLRDQSDPILQQAGRVVAHQVQQMARLLDDLLDVSRISRGKLRLRKEVVNVAEMARNGIETCRPLLDQRRHQLAIKIPQEPIWVEGDATRLEQIFANLLNNAAKYTDPGGQIEFAAGREQDVAVIRVRDTGTGIPREMLQRIFEPFVQVDPSLHRSQQGGLGIGLMLVRRLVEMHGGSVSAWSDGPGKGSVFVVRLPALVNPPSPDAQSSRQISEKATNGPTFSRKVLVIEDQTDSRETLKTLLTLWGHRVDVAENGRRGLEKALASRPEVALVDIGLPELDGYQLAEQVRASPSGNGIYLIALTGYGQPQDRKRALEAGFNAHLVKPVDPRELERLLAEAQVT